MFRFFELTEGEQDRQIDERIEADRSDTFWAEGVTDLVCEAMETLGVADPKVDGWDAAAGEASLSGVAEWETGVQRRVRETYPRWTDLHDLADRLQAIQRPHFYKLAFGIQSNGTRSKSSFIENTVTGDEPYLNDSEDSDRYIDLEDDIDGWIADLCSAMGERYEAAWDDIPEMAEEYCKDDDYGEQGLEVYEVEERMGPTTKILMVADGWGESFTPSGMPMAQWWLSTLQPGEVRDMSTHRRPGAHNPEPRPEILIDDPEGEVPYIPVYIDGEQPYAIGEMPKTAVMESYPAEMLQAHAFMYKLKEVCDEQ